ncbi:hypothetical protein L1887_52105 [Cichorium endivia]|nr:hypothetical protein L1887_52105 [Cichorium endivia]
MTGLRSAHHRYLHRLWTGSDLPIAMDETIFPRATSHCPSFRPHAMDLPGRQSLSQDAPRTLCDRFSLSSDAVVTEATGPSLVRRVWHRDPETRFFFSVSHRTGVPHRRLLPQSPRNFSSVLRPISQRWKQRASSHHGARLSGGGRSLSARSNPARQRRQVLRPARQARRSVRTTAISPPSRRPASKTPAPLSRFLAWCKAQGITIDPRLDLRYQGDAVSWSISVHAGAGIDRDEVVATIPKTAVLSRKTSALSHVLKGKWLSDSHETVGLELALCLLYERLLGAKSRFAPFIDILPRLPVPLPFLRDTARFRDYGAPPDPWRFIRNTEAGRINERASQVYMAATSEGVEWPYDHDYGMCRQKALDYFENIGIEVLKRSGLFDATQRQHLEMLETPFLTAYTHVSSRDFIVDTYHGVGLVPVADLFNHAETHTVQFESDQDVCEICGEALLTGHEEEECRSGLQDEEAESEDEASSTDEDEIKDEESEEEDDSQEEEEEAIKEEEAEVQVGPDAEADADEADADEGEDAATDDEADYVDTLDMRTLTPHACGDEMFNTYGTLPNALLLTRYGFCLDTETDVERYTLDLRFTSERKYFLEAFNSRHTNSYWASNNLDYELGKLASEHSSADGIDGLYQLDTLLPDGEWDAILAPLHRAAEGVDEDLVDRDQVHPLFIDSTGRTSRPLFTLVLLVHLGRRSRPRRSDQRDAEQHVRSRAAHCRDAAQLGQVVALLIEVRLAARGCARPRRTRLGCTVRDASIGAPCGAGARGALCGDFVVQRVPHRHRPEQAGVPVMRVRMPSVGCWNLCVRHGVADGGSEVGLGGENGMVRLKVENEGFRSGRVRQCRTTLQQPQS